MRWMMCIGLLWLGACDPSACEFEGQTYDDSESWIAPDGCNTCTCVDGITSCTAVACASEDTD